MRCYCRCNHQHSNIQPQLIRCRCCCRWQCCLSAAAAAADSTAAVCCSRLLVLLAAQACVLVGDVDVELVGALNNLLALASRHVMSDLRTQWQRRQADDTSATPLSQSTQQALSDRCRSRHPVRNALVGLCAQGRPALVIRQHRQSCCRCPAHCC